MKRRLSISEPGAGGAAPASGRAADMFVAIAIGIVALAAATALNLQLGVGTSAAVAAGAMLYALLLGLHVLLKRSSERDAEADADNSYGDGPTQSDFGHAHLGGRREFARVPPELPDHEALTPLRPRAPMAEVSLPPLTGSGARQTAQDPRPGTTRPVAPGNSGTAPQVRPRPLGPRRPAPGAEFAEVAPGTMEADVERIQALVKKLASEINAVEEAPEVRDERVYGRTPRMRPAGAVEGSATPPRAGANSVRPASRNASPSEPSPVAPARAVNPAPKPQNPTAPPPLSPAQAYTAAVADALVAGRVDVEIEPIVSLVDQRTRHYEVSVHVRGPAEERLVENNAFASLRGTGLLPLFDSARLQRSIGIAQRLAERAKDGRVFSIYSAESLTHASFLSDVRAALRDSGMGSQIVFAFDQSEIRNFAAPEWAALAELRQMQAVLTIDNVSHLDLDLKRLIAAGFGFARVPAADFISGLRFGGKPVPGADLQRYVAGIGLTLIAGQLDDEQQLQRVAALGAPFGQGKVFGGRRQVKLTTPRSSHAAA